MGPDEYKKYFEGKKGIEIGGPSRIFRYELPIYERLKDLDGCNYSVKTVWGNPGDSGVYKYLDSKRGKLFIAEASNLIGVAGESYDFLVASHCLEHCANVLKTVGEWLRVIKVGGAMLLVLPERSRTFDHRRPVTAFEHLLDDARRDVSEQDLTHLDEILLLHDLARDPPAGTPDNFKARSLDNFSNRCLHHHVFDLELLTKIFQHFHVRVVGTAFIQPFHLVILGEKI